MSERIEHRPLSTRLALSRSKTARAALGLPQFPVLLFKCSDRRSEQPQGKSDKAVGSDRAFYRLHNAHVKQHVLVGKRTKDLFRVAVTGNTRFDNYELLAESLHSLLSKRVEEGITVVTGQMEGAERMALRYAAECGHRAEIYDLDKKIGRRAAPLRNEEMLRASDAVAIFICEAGGGGRAVDSAIVYAHRFKLPVRIINDMSGLRTLSS